MRAFVLPGVARAAWLALAVLTAVWLAPGAALAAPKGKPAKGPKKPPVAKPAEPAEKPAPPDAEAEPAKDARTPPQSGAGAGGAAGGEKDDKKAEPADKDREKEAEKERAKEGEKPSGELDVDTLRREYLSLRDEVFRSRARANAVASQLYSTRMQIRLTYTTGRYYRPVKSSIRLDGAVVYEDTKGSIAEDDGVRFDGYVAPGRHLVTFRVEAVGKDDDTFSSVTESQITVKAVADKDLVVAAKARDGGDIAYEWKRKEKGSYGLGIDVAVKTQPRSEAKGKGK